MDSEPRENGGSVNQEATGGYQQEEAPPGDIGAGPEAGALAGQEAGGEQGSQEGAAPPPAGGGTAEEVLSRVAELLEIENELWKARRSQSSPPQAQPPSPMPAQPQQGTSGAGFDFDAFIREGGAYLDRYVDSLVQSRLGSIFENMQQYQQQTYLAAQIESVAPKIRSFIEQHHADLSDFSVQREFARNISIALEAAREIGNAAVLGEAPILESLLTLSKITVQARRPQVSPAAAAAAAGIGSGFSASSGVKQPQFTQEELRLMEEWGISPEEWLENKKTYGNL